MISRLVLSLLVVPAAVWLSGCATTGSQVSPAITSALTEQGVSGPTLEKVQSGLRLDYGDILQMVEKGVPDHIVESYLQSTQATYQFSDRQLANLRSAGASTQLVNYLTHTGGFYASAAPGTSSQAGATPRWEEDNSPLNQDMQPFAYNAPAVDYWYNSAYEESLYSPFSFDGD